MSTDAPRLATNLEEAPRASARLEPADGRVEPQAGVRVPNAAELPPSSYCLVDLTGAIIASDEVTRSALDEPPNSRGEKDQTLQQILASDSFKSAFAQIVAGAPVGTALAFLTANPEAAPVALDLTRLNGSLGPCVLVAFRALASGPGGSGVDALTQLPDRRAIAQRVEAWRHAAAPPGPKFAVLFFDLDDFKGVNDRHGHAVGDAVLRQLAARWLDCVRAGDLVARYGGDEFVALIENAGSAEDVGPIIQRLRQATRLPVVVGDLSLFVDATIGWSMPGDEPWTLEGLIDAADRDMYAGKRGAIR